MFNLKTNCKTMNLNLTTIYLQNKTTKKYTKLNSDAKCDTNKRPKFNM